jgi:hypothetical protein
MGIGKVAGKASAIGFGGVLMTAAERFLKFQAMSAAYVWCDPELVGYYEKRAYKVVDVPTGGRV